MPPAPCTSGSTISPAMSSPRVARKPASAASPGGIAWQRQNDMLGQRAGEHRMHPVVGIAHRHGRECVAVIAALESDEARAARARRG